MKNLLTVFVLAIIGLVANAKPHCQGFNNHDDKVTIVFTDDNAGKRYDVTDVKLIPTWMGKEYPATSVNTTIKDGVATVTLVFPHLTHFSNPRVTLRINGKKTKFEVYPLAELNQCVLNPAYGFVVNVIDVL